MWNLRKCNGLYPNKLFDDDDTEWIREFSFFDDAIVELLDCALCVFDDNSDFNPHGFLL